VAESGGGLSTEQRAQLQAARARLGPIERATRWATLTSWTLGIFGTLTVLWGLVAGAGGLVVGVALLAVAWNERRGRDQLRSLDPRGARILGWNQVVLAVVITVYLGFTIVRARTAPNPSVRELEELVGMDPGVVAQLTALVYGAVIVVVDIVQLFMARFHFRREAMVETLRREAPDWVLDVLTGSHV